MEEVNTAAGIAFQLGWQLAICFILVQVEKDHVGECIEVRVDIHKPLVPDKKAYNIQTDTDNTLDKYDGIYPLLVISMQSTAVPEACQKGAIPCAVVQIFGPSRSDSCMTLAS